jgi:hypothetical protein
MLRAICFAMGFASGFAVAQCLYPCWSEIAADKFTYASFENQPMPSASPPYEFSFPYPTQAKGGIKEGCDAQENPKVDLYRYDSATATWTGPLAGPIYTNPGYLQRSPLTDGWKGIAVQVSYEGKIDQFNGHTLIDSVFFHDERCYRASTEFGFSHYLKGLASDGNLSFYYEINANCKLKGKCRVHGTEDVLMDQRVNVAIPIPTKPNSHGGADWLYKAYLVDGGSKWHIRVVDPHNHKDVTAPIDHTIRDFFLDTAKDYFEHGATGYVTATATRDGALIDSGHRPVMNIVKMYSAK